MDSLFPPNHNPHKNGSNIIVGRNGIAGDTKGKSRKPLKIHRHDSLDNRTDGSPYIGKYKSAAAAEIMNSRDEKVILF